MNARVEVRGPQEGPQRRFAECDADIVVYGGEAGGGKSYALIMEGLRGWYLHGYSGIVFRRTYPEIKDPGALWDKSMEIFGPAGGKPKESDVEWRFPGGGRFKFSHMQHEKDRFRYQGGQFAYVGFDEGQHFTENQVFYLWGRCRSTCGIRSYMRITCNPDPNSWLRKFVDWWIDPKTGFAIPERDGVYRWMVRHTDRTYWADSPEELRKLIPAAFLDPDVEAKSVTFIKSSLDDNPALLEKEPGYKGTLMAMSYVDRQRLAKGNWNVQEAAGMYWKRDWFRFTPREPEGVAFWVRAWDKAASKPTPANPNPDWTVGVRYGVIPGRQGEKRYVIDGTSICRLQGSPHDVEQAMLRCANLDGPATAIALWQDPAQAGKADVDHLSSVLSKYRVVTQSTSGKKESWWGAPSAAAEHGLVTVLVPPSGALPDELEAFLHALERVPDGHDDDADALSLAHLQVQNIPTYGGYQPVTSGEYRRKTGAF